MFPFVVRLFVVMLGGEIVPFTPLLGKEYNEEQFSAISKALCPNTITAILVWIGHGMPKSKHHQDASDGDAIRALQERESSGLLHLVEMVTHEKVLIVDEQMFVNSSFNWLSYTGGDGRRETGTVMRGRLSHIRDKFLGDMRKKVAKFEYANAKPN